MKSNVAIVTGGGSGIGLAIAAKMCSEGIITYIVGRTADKLRSAQEKLGPNARIKVFDLDRISEIPHLIDSISEEAGSVDILVNNAGINMKKPFSDVSDQDFASILHTNVQSIFAMSREVVRIMRKQGHGSIVNISSMAAQYGIPFVIAYTASKTAVEGMTRAMAVELAADGIRVNCVAPGFIRTPMSAKALDSDPDRKNKVLGRTPMKSLGDPDDVAEAVYFLATESSKFTTGVVLPVDGGNSIGF